MKREHPRARFWCGQGLTGLIYRSLAGKYVEHMERQGVPFRTAFEQKVDGDCFSTDMGNVTYVVPSIHPTFEVCCFPPRLPTHYQAP